MDIWLLTFIAAAYFFAAFTKGMTGLGFSTTCLAVLALVVGIKQALPLLILPSLTSNFLVMRHAGHFQETMLRFWPLYLSAIPGVILGLLLLDYLNAPILAAALGIVLVGYCLFTLSRRELIMPNGFEKIFVAPTGFVTGVINGVTGSQVMPVLPFLLSLQLDSNRFVQAINISFTISSFIMMFGLIQLGLMPLESVLVSLGGIVFVYIGVQAGSRIRQRLSPEFYRKLVLIFLIMSGLGLIAKVF